MARADQERQQNVPTFDELSPEEQKEIRSKSRASLFLAAIMMTVLGAGCVIESVYVLTRDNAFLVERTGDANRAVTSASLTLAIGLFVLVSAYGTMRVVYTAWKAAFLTISVLATNRFVDSAVFNGTPFSIGSIITLIVTLFILMFLFAGRHSILPSRN